MKFWSFDALDSLFFRGAKPFNSGEGGFLDSQFPPSAQTMAGVIRSAIAEGLGVDWSRFHNGEQPQIAGLIGEQPDDAGKLSFTGPYVFKDGERMYPVPLHLLYSSDSGQWGRLVPAKAALTTDMGDKRLPEVEEKAEGAKPLENAWLDGNSLQKVLQGEMPEKVYKEDDLFVPENRTGIARNNWTRQTEEGALYFTRHLRLSPDVRLGMGVSGADDIQPASMARLGGEGRMAKVEVTDAPPVSVLKHHADSNSALIVLLTHGDFQGKSEPDIEGVEIVSACVGKAVREGGWDYCNNRPKPLKSLVPAGSVYFVRGDISKLGTHIGKRTEFGYGEIAVGIWEDR